MNTGFFDGIPPADVTGQHAALRRMIETLHGVQIPHAADNPLLTQFQLLGITPGEDLLHSLALLNDLVAAGLFDDLLKMTGVIEDEPHPYVIKIEDLEKRGGGSDAITLIQTNDGDSLFAVMRESCDDASAPIDVWNDDDGVLHKSHMSGHATLRTFLIKFFVMHDLGNSLMFTTFLENSDVDGFHSVATELYGQPAVVGERCFLFEADNVLIMLTGDNEPTMDLWVYDQSKPWARNAEFLRMTELTEAAIENWSTPR